MASGLSYGPREGLDIPTGLLLSPHLPLQQLRFTNKTETEVSGVFAITSAPAQVLRPWEVPRQALAPTFSTQDPRMAHTLRGLCPGPLS